MSMAHLQIVPFFLPPFLLSVSLHLCRLSNREIKQDHGLVYHESYGGGLENVCRRIMRLAEAYICHMIGDM